MARPMKSRVLDFEMSHSDRDDQRPTSTGS
jgi:hypothetical protein